MSLPELNSHGAFTATAPFTIPSGNYRCTALNEINGMIKDNVDVFSLYYSAYGVSNEVFDADLLTNVAIVTLISDTDEIINIPSSFISSSPELKGIPYANLYFMVSAGELPKDVAVSSIKANLKSLVDDALGVNSEVKVHVHQNSTTHSYQEHLTLEAARSLAIVHRVSDKRARDIAEAQNVEYVQRILNLQEAIVVLKTRLGE
jgi:hypothetical protein